MKRYLLIFLIPINTFAQIMITNGLTHEVKNYSGGEIIGKINLKNVGKKTDAFIVSKEDVIFECGVGFNFSTTKTHDRSLNNWIQFDVDEKVLKPNETYDLVYRINVPDDISSGTYWGVAMIEHGDPLPGAGNIQITTKSRYAVQILLHKGSFEPPKLAYKNVVILRSNGKNKTILAELENLGFFSAFVKTKLELYNEKGVKIRTILGNAKNIFPNRCNVYLIEANDLPLGKYDGVIMSDAGKKIYASNITFNID